MSDSEFIIVRQRAGPFVKAYATDRKSFVLRCLGDSPDKLRRRFVPALQRTSVDKLELRLALFGYHGIFYTLTFAPEFLPRDRRGVELAWKAFLRRLQRWWKEHGNGKDILYVYRIEGLHGDHRWHLHPFLDGRDFPPDVVRQLWDLGEVFAVPYDRRRIISEGGYRQLAKYITKERPEVGKHPWGCSRSLSRMLPLPEVRRSTTGRINLPQGAVPLPVENPGINQWGVFAYARYLEKSE